MRIALLGTGLMGKPMAGRLLTSGYEVTVYNRTREKAEQLQARGAAIAENPGEAVRSAECVVLMLGDAQAIRQVVLSDSTRKALVGRAVIQMGTIAPSETQVFDKEVGAAGGEYLEAPVLGSIPEAEAGNLIVMVGASSEQFERSSAVLRCFGPTPRLIGPVGQAAAMKLALNQLIASLTTAFALSMGLVLREEAPVDIFLTILRESALYAPTFDKKLSRLLNRNYANPNFPIQHLLKDVNLFLQEASYLGLETSVLTSVRHLLDKTVATGWGDADYSALFDIVNPETGGGGLKIRVERNLSAERLKNLGVETWPIWSKEVSIFPWTYDSTETCYFLEGKVTVTPEGGEPVQIGKGDFVTFPAGMVCTWDVRQPVKKHYWFE